MIYDISTAWLYAYSPDAADPSYAYFTVFVSGPRQPADNGQAILAQTSLSYLAAVEKQGAGATIHSYTPPFGPDVEFHDFKYNSIFEDEALAVTFELVANAAEAYSAATVYVFD